MTDREPYLRQWRPDRRPLRIVRSPESPISILPCRFELRTKPCNHDSSSVRPAGNAALDVPVKDFAVVTMDCLRKFLGSTIPRLKTSMINLILCSMHMQLRFHLVLIRASPAGLARPGVTWHDISAAAEQSCLEEVHIEDLREMRTLTAVRLSPPEPL